MGKKEAKTNAIRILETMKIPYEARTYECDDFVDAAQIADKLELDHAGMYKTITTVGKSGGYYVFVVPIDDEIDFKKAAKVIQKINNNKKIEIYPVDRWEYKANECDKNSFLGWCFQDSDVYKWIEAVAYSLKNSKDSELVQKVDEIINLICNAQMENGFLDTLYIINDRSKIFTNLKDRHELYCFGHLAEAAVAYYESTGKDKLLNSAIKFADLICDTFNEDNLKGYPGHDCRTCTC